MGQQVVYASDTPYYSTTQTGFALGFYVDRPIPADSSDMLYTIEKKYQHRPDALANDLYSDPNLFWIFARRNMDVIIDPIWDFVPGTEIYVPTKQRLIGLLTN
jgi:hypothetical protein